MAYTNNQNAGGLDTLTNSTIATGDLIILGDISDSNRAKGITVANLDTYLSATTKTLTNKTLTSPTLTTPTFGTSVTTDYLTASEIVISDASKKIVSAPVATYPSLAELAFVKGLTSAIQGQLDGKAASLGADDNYVTDAEKTVIGNTSGANSGDNAANSSSTYIGTTAVALNRSSAALTLAGITLTTPDIGTPSAGTLTNCTGLPLTGLVDDTSTALGVGTLELGHASDTTLARVSAGVISVEGVTIPSISSTSTLTNKRITKRVVTTADDATAVIDVDVTDVYELSAVANATEFTLTGTPTDGQQLIIRFKDAGTTKGLTWTGFTVIGVVLPTDTTAGKWHYVGCTYNLGATAWHVIAVEEQA